MLVTDFNSQTDAWAWCSTHHGKGTTFTFTASGLDSRGAPHVFTSGPIRIAKNSKARITGISRASLAGSSVRVTVNGRTLIVRNHSRVPQLASIVSLRVKKLRRHNVALMINARPTAPSTRRSARFCVARSERPPTNRQPFRASIKGHSLCNVYLPRTTLGTVQSDWPGHGYDAQRCC